MKALFWIGTVLLVLGIASLFVPIPHTDREGFKAGGLSVGVETQHRETVSPIVSGAMILAGAGMMIAPLQLNNQASLSKSFPSCAKAPRHWPKPAGHRGPRLTGSCACKVPSRRSPK